MTQPFFPARQFQMTDQLRFEIFLARLFGQKRQFTDNGYVATVYYFRGTGYMTECRLQRPGE